MKKRPKSLNEFIEWLDDKVYVGTQRHPRKCPIATFWEEKTGLPVRVEDCVSLNGKERKKHKWESEVMVAVDSFGKDPIWLDKRLSAADVKQILVDLNYMRKEEINGKETPDNPV